MRTLHVRAALLSLTLAVGCSKPASLERDAAPPPSFRDRPVATEAPPAPPALSASGDDASQAAPPMSAGAWRAARVEADGLVLGDFAVAAPPGPGHPDGILGALGWTNGQPADVYVVSIDVATAKELGRVRVGPAGGVATMLAAAPGGVAVANRSDKAIELTWVDAGSSVRARRSLPVVGGERSSRLRGFAGFDDRLVIAESDFRGGRETVAMRVVDDGGHVTASRVCRGGLHDPGDATLERVGDQVVLTNLNAENDHPICSLSLHGGTDGREARLPLGEVAARGGRLYFTSLAISPATSVLGPDLRPSGTPTTLPDEPATPACSGLTGTVPWKEAVVGGVRVVHMVSCCGDLSPGGLFFCRPPGP